MGEGSTNLRVSFKGHFLNMTKNCLICLSRHSPELTIQEFAFSALVGETQPKLCLENDQLV